ncbi:ribosomal protein S18 acetylase RimI-like enzyme [Paraburkholderia sp. EB58]|jgi:ribosomal protein S18 acetylase RimI-like enzyme|uniref:GNAT family N-acetyltransferase n=1 Tax=Paraburkholderia sp. EB58 TaxID=3035125 RepID=UPI003D1A7640
MGQTYTAAHDFLIRTMTPSEVELSLEWAASEGWNPGKHDARCFRAADPNGFFIGALQGEPIGCISAVAYDDRFGFIGLYLVKPQFRGMGFGMRIWQHGMAYLGNRNVGLDGVVAQQANYRKSGFQLAYRNIRFQGVVEGVVSARVSSVSELPFDQLVDYDQRFFPARRPRFLGEWLSQADSVALAVVQVARITGYGVLRACLAGYKIGPLFADNDQIAEELLGALAAHVPGQLLTLDVPESNPAAVALVERRDMTSVFETARMYTKESPALTAKHVFGVTSFELG